MTDPPWMDFLKGLPAARFYHLSCGWSGDALEVFAWDGVHAYDCCPQCGEAFPEWHDNDQQRTDPEDDQP